MSPDNSHLLLRILERLDADPPIVGWNEVQSFWGPSWTPFEAKGWVHELVLAGTVGCTECGYGCRVVCIESPESKRRRYFIRCHRCGGQELERDLLRRWEFGHEPFLESVREAAGAKGNLSVLQNRWLWSLGRWPMLAQRAEAVYVRSISRLDLNHLAASLPAHKPSLLFVSTEAMRQRYPLTPPPVIVALESVLTWEPPELKFDTAFVEDALQQAGLVLRAASRKRSQHQKREPRAAKIELLTKELEAHLRAARDHAEDTHQRTGIAELLERPSKQELGKRVGLSKYHVTRCFQDDSGKLLRMLWDITDNLDQILKWRR